MKTLYLMQGVPGSGKSTMAKAIKDGLDRGEAVICSTDNYWFDADGKYNYDISKASEAHEWNRNAVESLMADGMPNVIVDNTNTLRSQAQPYFDFADKYGYTLVVVRVDPGLDEALRRNSLRSEDRKIPEGVIHSMQARMEDLWTSI